jgi:hypothetical protein
MKKKNFIGFRDRVLIHLLQFEKNVYDNIHQNSVDGSDRDFLYFLTQEGIADGVGTKQSTIYKELQTLRIPTLEGEEPMIQIIEKVRIPGKERACAIYYLTPYGHDLAAQKRNYIEKKNISVEGKSDDVSLISVRDLAKQFINEGHEPNYLRALLRIAENTNSEGELNWTRLISPEVKASQDTKIGQEPKITPITTMVKKKPSTPLVDNPFFNRIAIKDPKYFYGREEEIEYIVSLLRNTQSSSIVGPRRVGKSSLINYVSNPDVLRDYGLNPEDYIFVSIDLEGLGELTQSEFFYLIIEEMRNNSSNPELRIKLERLLNKEDIRFMDLKNILREMTELDMKIIFLLDEFELITKNRNLDFNFFSGLRNLANSYNVGYITASHVPLLDLTFSQETLGSPFFNFFTKIELGLIKDSDYSKFILEPIKGFDVEFPEDIIQYIKRIAGPHVFFLQIICYHIFKTIRENGSISETDFPNITRKFMDESKPHFQYFWNHLTTPEQDLLVKLVDEKNIKEISKNSANFNDLQSLKSKALIIESSKGFRLYSNTFKEFIKTEIIQPGTSTISAQTGKATIDSEVGASQDDSVVTTEVAQATPGLTISWGTNYLFDEDTPKSSVELFNILTSLDISGLFITRTPISKAIEQWNLENSKVVWLCSRTGENFIRPALEKISHTIFEFVQRNQPSVVLLDGIEYIVNNNDFLRTLSLLDNLKEIIALNKSVLIIPLSSTIFSNKEMALIGKNSVEIPKNARFDFSHLEK